MTIRNKSRMGNSGTVLLAFFSVFQYNSQSLLAVELFLYCIILMANTSFLYTLIAVELSYVHAWMQYV